MPTNPKRRTGSKPARRHAAPTKAASSAPTNSTEEQEWYEGHVSDLDFLRSYDPLFMRCRQFPEVYEWCVAIHHLLLHAQHAGRWAERTSIQGGGGIEYTNSSTKLVSTCRVIQQAVRNMIDLDPEPLLLVQARRFRSKHLGGFAAEDAPTVRDRTARRSPRVACRQHGAKEQLRVGVDLILDRDRGIVVSEEVALLATPACSVDYGSWAEISPRTEGVRAPRTA